MKKKGQKATGWCKQAVRDGAVNKGIDETIMQSLKRSSILWQID